MKLAKNTALIKFLENTSTLTLAVPINEQGDLHAASLIYWNSVKPLRFYTVTSRSSEKCALLRPGDSIACAAVVGTERGASFTLQMRGTLFEAEPKDNQNALDNYYRKRGNTNDNISDPDNCLLVFMPKWARYTDYQQGYERHYLDLD